MKTFKQFELTIIGLFPSLGSGDPDTSGFNGDADVNDKSLTLLAVRNSIISKISKAINLSCAIFTVI